MFMARFTRTNWAARLLPAVFVLCLIAGHKELSRHIAVEASGQSTSANYELLHQIQHEAPVILVAFLPDGKLVVSASSDGAVKFWEAHSGKLVKTFSAGLKEVYSFALSPDGKVIAARGEELVVKLLDTQTGDLKHEISEVHADIVFSPDGNMIAGGDKDNGVTLWDVKAGKPIRVLKGRGHDLSAISFSPDGAMIAAGDLKIDWNKSTASIGTGGFGASLAMSPGNIMLWEAQTAKQKRSMSKHKSGINCVSFSPDSKIIASGSFDRSINLFDIQTGKLLFKLNEHGGPVTDITFSPDGKTLASGGWDNKVILWDTQTGKPLQTLTGHSEKVRAVAFSSDGLTLASGGNDHTAKLWRIK